MLIQFVSLSHLIIPTGPCIHKSLERSDITSTNCCCSFLQELMDLISRQKASVNVLLSCARGRRQIALSGFSRLQTLFLPSIRPILTAGKFGDEAVTCTRTRSQLPKGASAVDKLSPELLFIDPDRSTHNRIILETTTSPKRLLKHLDKTDPGVLKVTSLNRSRSLGPAFGIIG